MQAGLSLCWSHIPQCWKSHTWLNYGCIYTIAFWSELFIYTFMFASSQGCGETVRLPWLTWAFDVLQCDKCQWLVLRKSRQFGPWSWHWLFGLCWPLSSRLWCLLWVCHFPIGILGQVWYLIVSIPDLCNIITLVNSEHLIACGLFGLKSVIILDHFVKKSLVNSEQRYYMYHFNCARSCIFGHD